MKTTMQAKAASKQTLRNFGTVVGADTYAVWVRMISELVPNGRTHRLAVMLAGMLRYAAAIAAANQDEKGNERSDQDRVFWLFQLPVGLKEILNAHPVLLVRI
jgi:hypothetical protein